MSQHVSGSVIAAQYSVKRRTVRNWHKRGLIPAIQIGPRVFRFDPEAVQAALQNLASRGINPLQATANGSDTPAPQITEQKGGDA